GGGGGCSLGAGGGVVVCSVIITNPKLTRLFFVVMAHHVACLVERGEPEHPTRPRAATRAHRVGNTVLPDNRGLVLDAIGCGHGLACSAGYLGLVLFNVVGCGHGRNLASTAARSWPDSSLTCFHMARSWAACSRLRSSPK